MIEIVSGGEVIPMEPIKPKPPPIVLVAERFDNVMQFPSAIGHVDPFHDYPELPDFLDRRKARQQSTEVAA